MMTCAEMIRAKQKASNALWRELEQQGYHSGGGWHVKTHETAIIKGAGINAKIVGYVCTKDLSIRWINRTEE